MKIILTFAILLFGASVFAQKHAHDDTTKVLEAACGKCQFHMEGVKFCTLAVRLDGNAYVVKGSSIRDHGDMHAAEGLCSVVRKAEVTGHLEDNQFKVSAFKLLPYEAKKVKSVKKKVKG
jgi:hypothetical protein